LFCCHRSAFLWFLVLRILVGWSLKIGFATTVLPSLVDESRDSVWIPLLDNFVARLMAHEPIVLKQLSAADLRPSRVRCQYTLYSLYSGQVHLQILSLLLASKTDWNHLVKVKSVGLDRPPWRCSCTTVETNLEIRHRAKHKQHHKHFRRLSNCSKHPCKNEMAEVAVTAFSVSSSEIRARWTSAAACFPCCKYFIKAKKICVFPYFQTQWF
jgi:hypothetical protein